MRIEAPDPLQRAAVAAALGLEPVFEMLPYLNSDEHVAEWSELLENNLDLETRWHVIEKVAGLQLSSCEAVARSLIETECRVLLSGIGSPTKLIRALRQVDRIFAKPAWVGEFFRGAHVENDARLIEELNALCRRVSD